MAENEKVAINPDEVFYEREKFDLKTNNHGTVKDIEIEYKQFKTYAAVLAAFGGEEGARKVLNSKFKNRSKAAASAPIRLAPADADLAAVIKKGQEAAKTYEYEERGVGAKRRLDKIEAMKEDIKAGRIDLSKLSTEEIAEMMLAL